jgi:RNA polymerase sigma-70 factor (ECF subfamily)
MIDPDTELVARAGRGDRAAAQALMARHLPKMMTLARRMLGSQAEAEDAVQDAFLKLWTHAARWQPGKAKFETWLYRVTMNKCYDRLRRRPAAPLDEAAEVADPAPAADSLLETSALAGEIEAALAELPERQRAAIVLCHHQEKGNIEAAEIMGLSVEALESLLARGRRTLRARLGHLRA